MPEVKKDVGRASEIARDYAGFPTRPILGQLGEHPVDTCTSACQAQSYLHHILVHYGTYPCHVGSAAAAAAGMQGAGALRFRSFFYFLSLGSKMLTGQFTRTRSRWTWTQSIEEHSQILIRTQNSVVIVKCVRKHPTLHTIRIHYHCGFT